MVFFGVYMKPLT